MKKINTKQAQLMLDGGHSRLIAVQPNGKRRKLPPSTRVDDAMADTETTETLCIVTHGELAEVIPYVDETKVHAADFGMVITRRPPKIVK